MADQAVYDVFVGLHVAAAIVGFGAVALGGVYGGNARRLDQPGAVEELHRYFRAPGRLELVVLAVPVFGAAAVAVKVGGRGFDRLWVDLGLGLWALAALLLIGVVRPAGAVLRQASLAASAPGDPGPPAPSQAPSDEAVTSAGRRLQWAAAASDLVFGVALVIMVIQPGA